MTIGHNGPKKAGSRSVILRSTWSAGSSLFLVILLGYANSVHAPFVFDDRPAILENESIRHLWPISNVLCPPSTGGNTVSGRPLLNLSLAINFAISGTQVWSYHLFNVCLHFSTAFTLFGLIRRALELPDLRSRFSVAAQPFAISVALLWAAHPLLTQAITYTVQRAEALMGFFYLLTLYAFVRSIESPRPKRWLTLSVIACLCGMAAKESMVSAPLMVMLFDRTLVAKSIREAWRRHGVYYAALAGTWVLLAILIASTGGNRGGSLGYTSSVAWWTYAATEFHVIVRYLLLAIWPHPLIFEYDLPWARRASEILPYALVVGALAGATVIGLIRRSIFGVIGVWFFAILAPTSSVVPMQSIAEYRMYLPLAPVLCGVAAIFGTWLGRALLPVSIVAALVFSSLTIRRNADYQSELALWGDTVAKRPENARARCNFGIALIRVGRFEEAIAQLTEASRLRPNLAEAPGATGFAYLQTGNPATALPYLEEAVQLKHYDAEAQNNLGNTLLQLGRGAEAVSHYELAIQLKPDFSEAHFNLGNLALEAGRIDDALIHYGRALELTPRDPEIRNNFGAALFRAGQYGEARAQYEESIRLRPTDAEGHNNLGLVLLQLHRPEDAKAQYQIALQLRPDFRAARENLQRLEAAEKRK